MQDLKYAKLKADVAPLTVGKSNVNSDLLNRLKTVPWTVASKTFGNNHATLIGLLVSWWITEKPCAHWAIESGPSYGHRKKGIGGGLCDALLCEGDDVIGIVEVEGTRGEYTAEKLGKFFAAEVAHYKPLQFAIFLLYVPRPTGKGKNRMFRPAAHEPTLAQVVQVSSNYPDKEIVVLALDKLYDPKKQGIRSHNEKYFSGRLSNITGLLYVRGRKTATSILYEPPQAE